jgi:hypothetical protein
LSVVTDARLDAASTTGWYACALPRQHDGIQVVTLQDSGGLPVLERMTRFVTDNIEWRIVIDVVALPVDFRSWYYNSGA